MEDVYSWIIEIKTQQYNNIRDIMNMISANEDKETCRHVDVKRRMSDIENNINVGMQMPELDLEKLLATGGLDQFCGVLHVTLNRGDRLVARGSGSRL